MSDPKDILMICKGYYDKSLYHNTLEALNAYYHKHYGNRDLQLNYALAINLFLKPTIQFFLTADRLYSFMHNGLFEESYNEKRTMNPNGCTEFYEVLFNRLEIWLIMIQVKEKNELGVYKNLVDLSDYPMEDEKWTGVI